MTTEAGGQPKIAVCQHKTQKVPRQTDAEAFYHIYSGGMRAAEPSDNAWHIEPVLDDGHPCAKGFMSKAKLYAFFKQYGFTFIAFHRAGWHEGSYYSTWRPFIPGQSNHMRGPADLWSSLAGNIAEVRTAGDLKAMLQPTLEQIAVLFDNRTEAERLANSISLCLRNMDISIEQIAEFYNEQLVNHMASGKLMGELLSSTLDQTLFAHVHSFFVQLGAARDYLAAFCALRIGKDPRKVDSFRKLAGEVRLEHFAADNLLRLFQSRGYFQQTPNSSVKFELTGWMKEVSDLRNEFVHRRTYGDRFVEESGFVRPVDPEAGIYRYVRPIALKNAEDDVQNVLLHHYRQMTNLCHAAAVASGNDLSMLAFTDADIVSVEADSDTRPST